MGVTSASHPSLVLLRATHPGPAVAVTVIAGLLAVAAEREPSTVAVVTLAVLAGQLTVGWVNDLVDADRDRAVGRTDKPLATGELSVRSVTVALAVAATACLALSVAAGWPSAAVHLVLVLGSAHAYNLGLKATSLSWVPYAVAFGALPSVAFLAGTDGVLAPWWATLAGATLGVGAHLVNALPDLADDERTGVRGLPHRLGSTRTRRLAAALLAGASLAAALGPARPPGIWVGLALLLVAGLTVLCLVGRGPVPFRAAVAIAIVDVVLLVSAGR